MVKQSAKVLPTSNLDESKTFVSGGGNATKSNMNSIKEIVEISSESSSSDEDSDEENAEEEKSAAGGDVAMEDTAETPQEESEENVEPSFGDLVRANASEPVDVAGAFEDRADKIFKGSKQIQAPSGASLGTVLTQALKTNDVALLESCFHTTDHATIRATIQRLDSPLAGTLLQKLADRLHRKPGRAGSLMVWVQWTLVTHGGYLATQPALMKRLAELNRVIDERAKGLQSLLALKGKLDMLEAQMELRRNMQNQRQRMDEDDEEGVIYVEDQESEEEGGLKAQRNGDISDMESEASEDMPMTNGLIAESEDEEGDSSDEDDLIDDEAEDTDADTGDEDEIDHDDQDSIGEEDESDDGAAPPPKMPRTGSSSKRR